MVVSEIKLRNCERRSPGMQGLGPAVCMLAAHLRLLPPLPGLGLSGLPGRCCCGAAGAWAAVGKLPPRLGVTARAAGEDDWEAGRELTCCQQRAVESTSHVVCE